MAAVEEGLVVRFLGDETPLEKASDAAAKSLDKVDKASTAVTATLGKQVTVSTKVSQAAQQVAKSSAAAGGSLDRTSKSSGAATQSLVNLSRVAQDAPYGLLGIANNLNPLLEGFQRLTEESKAAGVSLGSQLKSALVGPAGIGIAVAVVSSLLIKYGSAIGEYLTAKTTAAERVQKGLNEALGEAQKSYGSELASLTALAAVAKDESLSRTQRLNAIKSLQKEYPDYLKNISLENINSTATAKAIDSLTQSIIQKAIAEAYADKVAKAALIVDEKRRNFYGKLQEQLDRTTGFYKAQTEAQKQGSFISKDIVKNEQLAQQRLGREIANASGELKEANEEFQLYTDSLKEATAESLNFIKVRPSGDVSKAKTDYNFFDKFFDFSPNGKLSDKQKSSLLDAAGEFQKDFRNIYQGLDFVLSDDENGLKAAIAFWENYKKGIVKFKPEAFLNDSLTLAAPEIKTNQADVSGLNRVFEGANDQGFINPDTKDILLTKYARIFKQIGRELPGKVKISTGQLIEVDQLNNLAELENGLKSALSGINSQLETTAELVGSVLTPAFQNFYSAALAGENPMKAFLQSVGQSVTQLIGQLIAAAIQAAILSAILPGGGANGFSSILGKITGFKIPGNAQGGIVPAGYENDSYLTRLSSHEAIIPLSKIHQYADMNGSGVDYLPAIQINGDTLLAWYERASKKQGRTR